MEEKEEVLETGTYKMISPGNGEIKIDKLILEGDNEVKRIWKLKEISKKEAIFEIIKFG